MEQRNEKWKTWTYISRCFYWSIPLDTNEQNFATLEKRLIKFSTARGYFGFPNLIHSVSPSLVVTWL